MYRNLKTSELLDLVLLDSEKSVQNLGIVQEFKSLLKLRSSIDYSNYIYHSGHQQQTRTFPIPNTNQIKFTHFMYAVLVDFQFLGDCLCFKTQHLRYSFF